MGFRKLVAFNQAMVAKQVWRIIQNPKSLVAEVPRGKYHPHTNFLRSKVGSNPSFIWKSLMWGKELIEKGSYWRVGNGRSVYAYRDKCIPRSNTFIITLPPYLGNNTKVSDLMTEDGLWDNYIISTHFNEVDASAISNICLGTIVRDELLVWHFYKKGDYTVKSGYHVAIQLNRQDSPSTSSNDRAKKIWKFLWAFNLPKKL